MFFLRGDNCRPSECPSGLKLMAFRLSKIVTWFLSSWNHSSSSRSPRSSPSNFIISIDFQATAKKKLDDWIKFANRRKIIVSKGIKRKRFMIMRANFVARMKNRSMSIYIDWYVEVIRDNLRLSPRFQWCFKRGRTRVEFVIEHFIDLSGRIILARVNQISDSMASLVKEIVSKNIVSNDVNSIGIR